MVAQITSSSSKKKSGGKEDILIDLMTKMSESYSKIKKENSELSARCVILENQNKVLKRQVEDFQEKLWQGACLFLATHKDPQQKSRCYIC